MRKDKEIDRQTGRYTATEVNKQIFRLVNRNIESTHL